MLHVLLLERILFKRTSNVKILSQIKYLCKRGLSGGRGLTWRVARIVPSLPIAEDGGAWKFRVLVELEKTNGNRAQEANQLERIKKYIIKSGNGAKFAKNPWILVALDNSIEGQSSPEENTSNQFEIIDTHEELDPAPVSHENNLLNRYVSWQNNSEDTMDSLIDDLNDSIKTVAHEKLFPKAKTWSDLIVPSELLGPNSDEFLSQHPAWKNLYGLNAQIRIILSNIQRAHETNGESRNHAVLFGHPGCGKTSTMSALETMFGKGSVLKLDAPSTTRAGLEKLFFKDYEDIPPLILLEEAEKAEWETLRIWLGALDERGEIKKVNFRENYLRNIKVLFICAVNNKSLFDRMMGSDGKEVGALSSRCVTQLYFPRPTEATLIQILHKEIKNKGGKEEWIHPAIQLASTMKINDPRIVCSYLAGGDRLLDGTYQRDWQQIYEAQKCFNSKYEGKS